jgi:uncharacterized protein (DUF58 family)
VLLVASINYQLNLGYLLTFLLAGSAVVGMHLCHGTLRGLTLHLQRPSRVCRRSVRCGSSCCQHPRTRHGIGLAVLDARHETPLGLDRRAGAGQRHGAGGLPARAARPAPVPPLTAETRFPLGTFRVWTVWRPAAQVLVYPHPRPPPPPLPPGEPRAGRRRPTARAASGEHDGVRAYRRGDPLKLVVWKKAAKARRR